MLVVSRRPGERVIIGEIVVVVLDVHRGEVRLGIEAPPHTMILRGELATRAPALRPLARGNTRGARGKSSK